MKGEPAPTASGRLMPRWWKALFLAGALLLGVGLVASLWVDDDRGPAPVSGLDSESGGS